MEFPKLIDSSAASDGIKNLKVGIDIGSRYSKLQHISFNKDYLNKKPTGQFVTSKKYKAKLESGNSFCSSERILMGEKFQQRSQVPSLIVNLDGGVGTWDYQREMYVFRPKVLEALISLSHDY